MKLKTYNKFYRRVLALVFTTFGLAILLLLFLIFLLARTNLFATEVISENTGLIVVLSVVSLMIIAQIITIVFVRWFIQPINTISAELNRIARGDFDVQIDTSKYKKEMKVVADDLNKTAEELKSIEVMRSDFVSSVSHEFRAPISSIQGYVTLLSEPGITEEQRKDYFLKLSESTRQLTGLVDNVLRLSRLESQRLPAEEKVFSLDEQLRRAVLVFEQEWTRKNIEPVLNLPEYDIKGNEELLNQLWLNLIGNAVKFTDENGKIEITLDTTQREYLTVTVCDNGIGMSEEVQKHIFEKFYQADIARKVEGNGLGLSLVKSIADIACLGIEVESREGEGSTFRVKIPKNQ